MSALSGVGAIIGRIALGIAVLAALVFAGFHWLGALWVVGCFLAAVGVANLTFIIGDLTLIVAHRLYERIR